MFFRGPSSPTIWSGTDDPFSKLINELTAEHSRVVSERDQLRRLCYARGIDASSTREARAVESGGGGSSGSTNFLGLGQCMTRPSVSQEHVVYMTQSGDDEDAVSSKLSDSVAEENDFASTEFDDKPSRRVVRVIETCPSRVRPPATIHINGELDEEEDDDDADDPGSVRTPRALRSLRADGNLQSWEIGSDAGTSNRVKESDALELHTRWLDLFVANQMKIDVGDDVKQKSSNLGMVLRRRPGIIVNHALVEHLEDGTTGPCTSFCSSDVPIMPNSRFRFAWDMLSVPIIMHDVILIPMQLAWNLEPSIGVVRLMMMYWIVDVFINFNTAFPRNGQFIMKRSQVTKQYLMLRFWLDFFLILLDTFALADPGQFAEVSWYRGVRGVRVLRILRAFRLSKVQEGLEEMFMDSGIEKLMLFFAIAQTVTVIFIFAHILSCGWYFLGKNQSEEVNWTMLLDEEQVDLFGSYVHCLYWTLGHILGGATNPIIKPLTLAERVYTVFMVAISVLVVGAGISKMTNTIADLQRVNMEAKDTRRKLIQVLRASNADTDLTNRILRFGMHLFRRKASLSLEDSVMGLLSTNLAHELTLSQRSRYLTEHPLMFLIENSFGDVYLQLCGAFESHIYADGDVIYMEGIVAEAMYMTIRGNFLVECSDPQMVRLQPDLESKLPVGIHGDIDSRLGSVKFSGVKWLCELALFATMVHKNQLKTTTFADSFTLKGDDFAAVIGRSPRCITKVYLYATEYIQMFQRFQLEDDDELDCEFIPREFSQKICNKLDDSKDQQEIHHDLDSPITDQDKLSELLDDILAKRCTNAVHLSERVPQVFGELSSPNGIYEGLKMQPELKRSMAAMFAVIWLVQDEYDSFTASQLPRSKMSLEVWQDMQRFVRWAGITKSSLHAMLCFLAIRGIGKAAPFLQAMQRECRTAEDVVVTLMTQLPRKVPSFLALGENEQRLLEKAFNIHRSFNFAQLLQGENTPYHIAVLQRLVQMEGQEVFKFYLFSLVGVMCGLRGAESLKGSLFMDQINGATLMAGINILQKLEASTANAIYWGYIGERANQLGLPFHELEHLALARLACLTRAKQADVGALQVEWYRLNRSDREAFTRHFIGDGLYQSTYVFTFLPAYLANAKSNKAVGLYRAMVVLVELIDLLSSDGHLERSGARIVTVNLQDLADFTQKVESSGVFMAVHVHSSLVTRQDRLDFIVSAKHKQHTSHQNWSDDPTHEMRALMRRMDRRVGSVNKELERLAQANPKMARDLSFASANGGENFIGSA